MLPKQSCFFGGRGKNAICYNYVELFCICRCLSMCPDFVQIYLLNHSTFCNPTWCGVDLHQQECHANKLGCCLQLQGQDHSEASYNQNRTDSVIVWTNDSFAARLNFAIDHLKLECLVKTLDCFQSQHHSKSLKFELMFVWMISFELLDLM